MMANLILELRMTRGKKRRGGRRDIRRAMTRKLLMQSFSAVPEFEKSCKDDFCLYENKREREGRINVIKKKTVANLKSFVLK